MALKQAPPLPPLISHIHCAQVGLFAFLSGKMINSFVFALMIELQAVCLEVALSAL